MVDRVECVVIGAGVIGLAVARRLAMAGKEVVVLETAETIGTGVSSRNSEVIHAGIYYPKDSLKARFCVEGKHALYPYCRTHGVAHKQSGKLIVATSDDQIAELERLKAAAASNGVTDLEWLSAEDVREMEPAVFCVRALHSPTTGIIDSHGLMLAYQGDAEDHGAMIAFAAPVTGGRIEDDGILIEVGGPESGSIKTDITVNSAGLFAQSVARDIAGIAPDTIPPSGVSGTGKGWSRGPRDRRYGRPGAVRTRRGMGRNARLRR